MWSVAKVPNDYLVTDGRNKYSVPYNLIGEKVDIRVSMRERNGLKSSRSKGGEEDA